MMSVEERESLEEGLFWSREYLCECEMTNENGKLDDEIGRIKRGVAKIEAALAADRKKEIDTLREENDRLREAAEAMRAKDVRSLLQEAKDALESAPFVVTEGRYTDLRARIANALKCNADVDSITGCADDQAWAGVPVGTLRAALKDK
jgi:hypothetical protein